ncbi:MAG: nucleotide exchange factor GrpE [Catalinimonas sp.]
MAEEKEPQEELTTEPTAETDTQAAPEADESPVVEDEATRVQQELGEAKEKYIRIYSEFENYRRRTSRERLELVSTATKELMQALLPVVDDGRRAERSFDGAQDLEAVREGVQLVFQKLFRTLEQKGLRSMDVRAGDAFDAELHEAVTQIPAPSDDLKGKVVDVIEQGYFLQEKPIRFAKVVTGA